MAVTSGLAAIDAPLPSPRQFDLLAAANVTDPDSVRWLAGATIGGYLPGPAGTFDACSSGTNRVKPAAGTIALPMAGTFQVVMTAMCAAMSVGANAEYQTTRLKLALQAYEGAAVERVMVSGDGHNTLGDYLGDPEMKQLGGGAVSPLDGLSLLEDEIARHGTGMIHATPRTATYWQSLTLIAPKGGVMYTALGTPVAIGAGYIDAQPDNEAAATDDEAWAFASGPVQILRRNDIQIYPDRASQSVDRETNDVLHVAERPYLIDWVARQDTNDEDHTQAGVLIDFTA